MTKISEKKKEVRKQIGAIKDALPKAYYKEASEKITQNLMAMEAYQRARVVFAFISMEQEPDTKGIIADAWKRGKTVAVPRCIANRGMELCVIRDFRELKKGAYGIMEPAGEEVLEAKDIDFALIPCVSAGKDGKRLGHGGGYYDVFLAEANCKKVCICFEKLMSDDIPMEKHDKFMDHIVTENQIYTCEGLR